MLLEKPQVRSVKTEHQKRKHEEKSLENADREKSKVYRGKKMRWNERKMVMNAHALRPPEV